MNPRVYNLIYSIYVRLFGTDIVFESAKQEEYEKKSIEMLERINKGVRDF